MDSQEQTDKHEISEDQWTEDFLKQSVDQFEKNLQKLLHNGETIKAMQRRLKHYMLL